ncbi:MAG: radical SAM protein [Heliobacteriaceae bacterium]|jgi:MoaA/NifB/PqqE/SkfB family radical SAM enzyme|nr:radical SAM protein [Heliobacteriaceae bacterium]
MKTTICKAPASELKELNNLFIELTQKNCNQRCKHCYIDFPLSKKVKDFISPDMVKQALQDTKDDKIICVYLTGAEPMTHPDFNNILRLCLKRTNVCIHTNGTFINEKKARFLKKVEEESNFEIIFKLSMDHWDELKSDDLRGRGAYRQAVYALKSLVKYDFNIILCITNYYKEDKKVLIEQFRQICAKNGFAAEKHNFVINEYYDRSNPVKEFDGEWSSLDCEYGRILTAKGVYTCPFLANDHRGRCGTSFKDYSVKTALETDCCASCIKNKELLFGINYKLFE